MKNTHIHSLLTHYHARDSTADATGGKKRGGKKRGAERVRREKSKNTERVFAGGSMDLARLPRWNPYTTIARGPRSKVLGFGPNGPNFTEFRPFRLGPRQK